MNKKYINLFLLICCLLLLCISVAAHPGRTDAKGGHWDRENGTYHFHTGEYAGRSSSGSSSTEYDSFTPPYETPAKQIKSILSAIMDWIIKILSYTLVALFLSMYILALLIPICEKLSPNYHISIFEEKLNELIDCRKKYAEIKSRLIQRKDELQIPDAYEIGTDDLPKEKHCTDWGTTFTLYTSTKGIKFHTKYGCSSAIHKEHIYRIYKSIYLSDILCKKCSEKYEPPNLSWYMNYLSCKKLHNELQSIKLHHSWLQKEIHSQYEKCNSSHLKFLLFFSKKNTRRLKFANKKYYVLTKNTTNKVKS